MLARVPSFRPSIDAWVAGALEVVGRARGHRVARDPDLALRPRAAGGVRDRDRQVLPQRVREAILLEVCDAGIVFLPGAAGTVQEVFQDACENYYADEASVASMVLVGVRYWTRDAPRLAAAQALARGRPMEDHVHLVDTVDAAAALLG